MDQIIDRARRFNRFYTRAIGMLGEGYLGSGFTLAEARVIYEIAHRDRPTASDIGPALGLDPGYLSRILKRLEAQGLVARVKAHDDRRQSRLTLTPAGAAAFADLDGGARRSMGALIEHLGPGELDRLSGAMAQIETLLTPRPAGEIMLRPPQPGDLGWVVSRHAAIYAREQGWGPRFEAHVAELIGKLGLNADVTRERCWIAECDGDKLGCVFLAKDDETTARIRLLLLEPHARGLGLGRRLVQQCLTFARQAGYRDVVLWTHAQLAAARALYAAFGFVKEAEAAHSEFGPEVLSETWRMTL